MDDSRQILSKHLSQLTLNLALDELLDDSDTIKAGININILERICFEYEGYAFLFGDY